MKKTICMLLVLVLAAGFLLDASATESLLPPELVELEPLNASDPAGVASAQGAVPYAEATEPTLPEEITAIGAEGTVENYLNDGGRYPVPAMVSFMDDDCRAAAYDVLYQQVIEPLGIPYTLALPVEYLDREGYISQSQLQEMVDSGVTISCHTLTEKTMTDYNVWELDEMLAQWKEEAELAGCGEVLSYSYCNGVWTEDLMAAVKAHFRMGFTVEPGINQIPYESYYMKRVGLFSVKSTPVELGVRDGTYLNANGTLIASTTGQRITSLPVPVKAGEEYLVTCSAVWNGAAYVIRDADGKIIEKYNVPDTARGELLIERSIRIPAGGATLTLSHITGVYSGTTMTLAKKTTGATMADAKAYVDQVAQEGGWLVFMTHAWYKDFSVSELTELVEYIRDAGIPIVDVNDAIRLTGNVIEVGDFRKPLEYAPSPYFVVSADGRVFTNGLEQPDVPESYENVPLTLTSNRVLYNKRLASSSDPGYVTAGPVDVSGCSAVLVTGWAYSAGNGKGYQIYTITDADGTVLQHHDASAVYADGGELLDHMYIELPEGAAFITIAGNIYHARPELTKIRSDG